MCGQDAIGPQEVGLQCPSVNKATHLTKSKHSWSHPMTGSARPCALNRTSLFGIVNCAAMFCRLKCYSKRIRSPEDPLSAVSPTLMPRIFVPLHIGARAQDTDISDRTHRFSAAPSSDRVDEANRINLISIMPSGPSGVYRPQVLPILFHHNSPSSLISLTSCNSQVSIGSRRVGTSTTIRRLIIGSRSRNRNRIRHRHHTRHSQSHAVLVESMTYIHPPTGRTPV